MAIDLSNVPLEITCPQCKRKVQGKASVFSKKGVACPGCGTVITVNGVKQVEKKIEKTIKDAFKGLEL